jgi:signal transduction histidine kinase
MKMRMSGLRSKLQKSDSAQAEDSRAVIELIDSSIRSVHDIVSELRPTVLFHGVVAALEWLVAELNKQPGLKCELKVDEEDGVFVSDELTTLVFRVAQETLEHAMRHANVTHVIVSWTSNKNCHCLAVQHDCVSQIAELSNGKSLSFFGMQERIAAFGGEMQVFSTLDHGTVIEASFRNQ